MTEDVRDAVADLFAAHEESGFVESAWVADDVNFCVGPAGGSDVAVDVEVAHTRDDVDLQAIADDEPALESLDGDVGAVGRAILAAVDKRATHPVDSLPFAIVVDNEVGVRCASFRTTATLTE
ncbi:MAG: hypothetical protein ABEJ68_04880 [Halobacteriaceae archaeon]